MFVQPQQDIVAQQAQIMQQRIGAGLAVVRKRRYECEKVVVFYDNWLLQAKKRVRARYD